MKGANAGEPAAVAAQGDPSTSNQPFERDLVLDAVDLALLNTGHTERIPREGVPKNGGLIRHTPANDAPTVVRGMNANAPFALDATGPVIHRDRMLTCPAPLGALVADNDYEAGYLADKPPLM
jgi:hypothetical protein